MPQLDRRERGYDGKGDRRIRKVRHRHSHFYFLGSGWGRFCRQTLRQMLAIRAWGSGIKPETKELAMINIPKRWLALATAAAVLLGFAPGTPAQDIYKDKTLTFIVGYSPGGTYDQYTRSEEHTSELQSRLQLVCRLLLEK